MAKLSRKQGTPADKNVADLFSGVRSADSIGKTHTHELVIALCGPIGSPMHEVAEAITLMLKDTFGYEKCPQLRLSEFIGQYASKVGMTINAKPGFERIRNQIDAGNKLRETYGNSVLAELAVNAIRLDRESHKETTGHKHYAPRRICHIIDSIKNQEELDLLRMVYREMLYVVGVFSPLAQREENLKRKDLDAHDVYQLIDRDSGEESRSGQTVRDTFPQSDFFLRTDNGTDSQLQREVGRFLHLILGARVMTPTPEEAAMYAAASAAANSACLSRQVGAAVTTAEGVVLATGWNDVPRKGGGLYVASADDPGGERDQRCWNRDGGKCSNQEEKTLFANRLLEALEGFIPESKLDQAREAVSSFSKLKGLIEFSRSIHAEMHAILNAGRVGGDKMVGGKLFVTTYPCHSCARHIVAAGIDEVYYIEPYRKSLAIRLHGDAISERETDSGKVRLLPFSGVAPSRYLDLFRVPTDSRKGKGGLMIKVAPKDASPRLEKSMEAFPALEGLVIESLARLKLIDVEDVDDGKGSVPPAA